MTPSPLERAARAAYTRPDSTLAWERRAPRRRAYWRTVTRRALDAALDREDLARVIHDAECACGYDGEHTWADIDRRTGLADAIRAHVLAPIVHLAAKDQADNQGEDLR